MISQLLVNGIIAGSAFALVALGFSLIYKTTGFIHFAHAAIYMLGAYSVYTLVEFLHLPLPMAIFLGILFCAAFGILLEIGIYRPLRYRNGQPLILLIASIGIYVIIQNIISLIFGDDVKTLRYGATSEGWPLFGARITAIQLITILSAFVLFLLTSILVFRTKLGKMLRAVANDHELAGISGITANEVNVFVLAAGSALAAIAAILVSFDVDMTPTMGMNALLMGMVVTVIGGIGSIPGALVGGLLLGFAQQFGVWKIGSEWQDAIAFGILLIFLLFRPYGIFGRKLRKAEV